MYGEPSAYEYGRMISKADEAISTDGFKCCHNNVGWLGYYITTPCGFKYQLVKKSTFGSNGYYLCEYSDIPFQTGKSLGLEFSTLDECKQYLLRKEE